MLWSEWPFFSGCQGQQIAMQGCGLGHFVQVVSVNYLPINCDLKILLLKIGFFIEKPPVTSSN
jgi:hypothetical protein